MLIRSDQDSWPALTAIADYFCKGGFSETQASNTSKSESTTAEEYLMRAASGSGIVSLHHTITYYAIEKARNLVSTSEYMNMVKNWINFVGEKPVRPFRVESEEIKGFNTYAEFFEAFSSKKVGEMTLRLSSYLDTEQKRLQLGEFLVRGVCDLYDGDYDPHYLTGLGSVLWFVDRYHAKKALSLTALYQYLDYFFAF